MLSDTVDHTPADMAGVRVAVVDSGIQPDHPHVDGISGGISLTAGSASDDYIDRVGHGTAVAAVIRERAPDARLVAVKIFDTGLAGSVDALVRAIDWAITHDCRVVNLSLGTSNPAHTERLQQAVNRALARDVVLVAALEDGGRRWLPGCLPGVMGVTVDWNCPRDRFGVERASDGRIVYRASGYPRDIPGVPRTRNLMGVSFAVAHMTGFVADLLARHAGVDRSALDRRMAEDAREAVSTASLDIHIPDFTSHDGGLA